MLNFVNLLYKLHLKDEILHYKLQNKPSHAIIKHMSKDNFQENLPKLSLNERVNFFSEFHSYLSSSIPITTALSNIQKYTNSFRVKEIAGKLLLEIDKGENFSNAILKFKKAFGGVYCNLMSVGAQSGDLPKILQEIHNSLKKQRTTIYNLIRAAIYPATLFLMLIAAFFLLIFFIAPRLSTQYQNTTGEAMTQNMSSMQAISAMFTDNWFFIIFVIGLFIWGLISGIKYLLKSEAGIKFPVFGAIIKFYNLSIFSKLLAISYSAGLPITHGILLSSEPVHNEYLQKKLIKCSTYISKHSLTDSFAGTGFFSPQMLSKIQAGEQTGNLDRALSEISEEIDETLETTLSAALQLVEPLLLIIIAGFIILFGTTLMNALFMV